MVAFRGHFDGKVIVPDEPVNLLPGQRLMLRAEPEPTGTAGSAAEAARRLAQDAPWANRDDIGDSAEFARKLRHEAENRRRD